MENENIQIARRWFEEVWNQRKLDIIDELLAPDAVAHDFGGHGSSTVGSAEFKAAARQLQEAFGVMVLTVEDIFSAGDRVAVRLTGRMKSTGPLQGRPPTGKEVTVPILCIIKVKDGKIVEGWNAWDVACALRATDAPADQLTIL